MSITNRHDILVAVQKTLRSLIDGNSPYVNDLTDVANTDTTAQQVQLGTFKRPPVPVHDGRPFVAVSDAGTDSEGGYAMTEMQSTGSFLIVGWCFGDPTEPDSRLTAAAQLNVDLQRALSSNLQLRTADHPTGYVDRFQLASQTMEGRDQDSAGQDIDATQWGVCVLVLTAVWRDALPDQTTDGAGIA